MVTWSRAFKAAGVYVAYSIIWDILGGAILTFGVITLGTGLSAPSFASIQPNPYQLAVGIVVSVVGFILILLGNIATFFKVNTDIIVQDMAETFQQEEKPQITA